jgi:PadR family transcriptional regulator PadR
MVENADLVRGTLETIILEVVAVRAMYGYEICKVVDRRSNGQLELREGSLYPALHKLEKAGLLASRWVESEEGRRRKYYELTGEGRRALEHRRDEWRRFSGAVNAIVGGAHVAIA